MGGRQLVLIEDFTIGSFAAMKIGAYQEAMPVSS